MASTEPMGLPAQQQKTAKEIQDAKAMPPPPVPVKNVLLETELNALQDSLKNAVAQTGLVYKYYAKTFEPELRHVPPPQSLTGALGRELEKYDQVCDAMEAQILRAISILQRDLAREEKRIEEEQLALKAKEREKTPEPTQDDESSTQPMTQPTTANNSPISGTHPGRRPSAISISSLHRPAFTHKLDLTSVVYRPSDENTIQSGLGSPVTLAPKSARPTGANDLSDFMFPSGSESSSRPPDIDLTISDIIPSTSVDLSAGGSSDKPIELDLDDELDVNAAISKFYGVDSSSSTANAEGPDNLFATDIVAGGDSTADRELKGLKDSDFFKQLGLPNLQPGEASKPTTSQAETLSTVLSNFNHDPANAESSLSNITDQNFDFDTVIDLTSDDIDLTHLDSNFFSSSNQPNPDVNFPLDFTMGEPNEETKAGASSSNS